MNNEYISISMRILNFKGFMKKQDYRKATMNESELQRVNKYHIYPRAPKIYSDKRFLNIDNGFPGGTHWICFILKDNKFLYFDSFGGATDKFLVNQLAKPIIFHKYRFQVINSKL